MVLVPVQVGPLDQLLHLVPLLLLFLFTLERQGTTTAELTAVMVVKQVEIPKLRRGGILTFNQVKVVLADRTAVIPILVATTAAAAVAAPDLGMVELENQDLMVLKAELW